MEQLCNAISEKHNITKDHKQDLCLCLQFNKLLLAVLRLRMYCEKYVRQVCFQTFLHNLTGWSESNNTFVNGKTHTQSNGNGQQLLPVLHRPISLCYCFVHHFLLWFQIMLLCCDDLVTAEQDTLRLLTLWLLQSECITSQGVMQGTATNMSAKKESRLFPNQTPTLYSNTGLLC